MTKLKEPIFLKIEKEGGFLHRK